MMDARLEGELMEVKDESSSREEKFEFDELSKTAERTKTLLEKCNEEGNSRTKYGSTSAIEKMSKNPDGSEDVFNIGVELVKRKFARAHEEVAREEPGHEKSLEARLTRFEKETRSRMTDFQELLWQQGCHFEEMERNNARRWENMEKFLPILYDLYEERLVMTEMKRSELDEHEDEGSRGKVSVYF